MSRRWSQRSLEVYLELDPRLQELADWLLHNVADISLIDGHRTKEEQDEYFEANVTTVRWPNSKHNKLPSLAFDFQPYPYPTSEPKLWAALAYVAGHAVMWGKQKNIRIRWGGDWNSNGDLTDQNFDDLFHIEIAGD